LLEPNSEALEHLALADFIASGQFERHVRRVRKIYAANRQALIYNLKQEFRQQIEIPAESGGSHQLVKLSTDYDDESLETFGLMAGLGITSTRAYYIGVPRKREFIIDFSCLDAAAAHDVVVRFHTLCAS
jgi:GntR family transcriptional regulator/MocR family aminotransferase